MSGRRGFTLLEVIVALAITGTVALLAHQLAGVAADHARRLRDVRTELDRRGNAHRLLRAAFLSLEVGLDSAAPFLGEPGRVRFSAWLSTSDGWPERREVELRLDGDRWVALAPPELAAELAAGVTGLRFDYLLEPGAQATWVSQWESAVSAPLAVRVRVRHGAAPTDTMVYLIRSRG